jgi:hypothetical protein
VAPVIFAILVTQPSVVALQSYCAGVALFGCHGKQASNPLAAAALALV